MVSWRALAVGLAAVPLTLVWVAVVNPFAALVAGFLPGALAAALAPPGARSGTVHALAVAGVLVGGTLAALAAWLTLSPPEYVAPAFGMSLVLVVGVAVVLALECLVAGTVVGALRS